MINNSTGFADDFISTMMSFDSFKEELGDIIGLEDLDFLFKPPTSQ
jgi:hypothetical protein